MNRARIVGIGGLAVVLFGLGVLLGVVLDRQVSYKTAVPTSGAAQFQLIVQAWNDTRRVYVDQSATDPTRLAYGAVAGMIDSLGDTGHSDFLTPEQVKQEDNARKGLLVGIGIQVQFNNGHVVVVAPIDGSPAQKAGIKAGDVILAVDGKTVSSLSEVAQSIYGTEGTPVTVTLSSGGQTRDVTVMRALISVKSVSSSRVPGTTLYHVRIASFSSGTTVELQKALAAVKDSGGSGIILDLRQDPGGLLDEAIGVTSSFLSSGNVLLERSADGTIKPVPVVAAPGGVVTSVPIVVLIDGGTASASEIVAGALQDAGRARIVGETSFGTGTVLQQFPLADGSAIRLAIQEWLTPSGRTIWHKGLTPDVQVTLPSGVAAVVPDAEAAMTADQLAKSGDQQVLTAVKMLGG